MKHQPLFGYGDISIELEVIPTCKCPKCGKFFTSELIRVENIDDELVVYAVCECGYEDAV